MQHAESKKLIAAAEEFRAERGACVFTAEVSTDIDKAGPKDRVHGIAILKGLSPEQYEQKMAAILDGMYALPAVDTYMLKSTVVRRVWGETLRNLTIPILLVPEEQEHGQSLACTGSPRARGHPRRALRVRGNCGVVCFCTILTCSIFFLLRSEPRSLDEGIPLIFILRVGTT
jgi:hypothetical protein